MRTLVIYYSKTGFAKRYAQWLEEDLACRCVPFSQRDSVDLAAYDKVVFGSSVHAGGIRKLGWFKKQLPRLRGKRLAVFFTGAMPPEEHTVEQCVAQNLTPEERRQVRAFYLWGGLNYEAMGPVDKWMMGVFRKMLAGKKNPPQRTGWPPRWWPPLMIRRSASTWSPWRNTCGDEASPPGTKRKAAQRAAFFTGWRFFNSSAPRR